MKGDSSTEAQRLKLLSYTKYIPIITTEKNKKCDENYIPSGSVEWCLLNLGFTVKPDYYPNFLKPYLKREIWELDKWPLKKVFIKPSDRYKRFTGFVTHGTYSKKKKPPFICSEIIDDIENEWRYYVTNGKILTGEWYWGDDVNTPDAPELNIDIPENYSGAIDFGMSKNKGLILMEAQHPFACGWYGEREKDLIYFQWIIDGWKYMKKHKIS